MPTRISLNGTDWLCKPFLGEDWRWRSSHKPDTLDKRHWLRGTVPGSVYHDLWHAGAIANPYQDRNSLLAEWAADRTWVYKRAFAVDEAQRGKRARLIFHGVDYEAQFFLNGELLGSHRSMYTPAVFEVGERLRYGEPNLLAVVIEPAPQEQPQVGRTSLVRTHKSRMTYWWDFCPRLVHLGIWDAVELELGGPVRVEDLWARPQLADDLASARVLVSAELSATQASSVRVETTLSFEGRELARQQAEHSLQPGQTRIEAELEVPEPQLWWPNGHGAQPLYEVSLRVVDQAEPQAPSDERSVRVGLRRIALAPNQTPDETARPYTLVVNGKQIYIKGWNWVPIDIMYGVERPHKLERLLSLARRAHVNMLRVWGGGLIEKEAFYDLCDRYGILVWQEFIQSSSGIDNWPADDPAFIELMVREAEQIVPRKRNHPALAIWGGGNELQDANNLPLDDSTPVLGALRQVVERLDPDRLWLPTSPTGRCFGNDLEHIERDPLGQHDVHGPWEYQGLTSQYTLYNRATSLLHSEFGVEGLTNLRTYEASISPEHRWPVAKPNPVLFHSAAWWLKEQAWAAALGPVEQLERLLRGSQLLQAEGLRYAIEANRRRKYQNSGSLPWQFNEPYPNPACTSAVDYYAQPKPAYYAVARAYRPLAVSAVFATQAWEGQRLFETELWFANSQEQGWQEARLELALVGASGKTYNHEKRSVSLQPNAATPLGTWSRPLDGIDEPVFFLDLRVYSAADELLAENRYPFSAAATLAPLLAAPATSLDLRSEQQGDRWLIKLSNNGQHAALFVQLDVARALEAPGYAYFEDNHFTLLPGESRALSVDWVDIPPGERRVEISSWNTGVLSIG